MSNLQDALDRYDEWINPPDEADISTFVLAARLVANPNIEAATRYAVRFFMGDKAADKPIPPHIQSGVERIVTIALTPGDTG